MAYNDKIIQVNGVELAVETFGDPSDAAMLLVGQSMLSWDEELCERLARGGRFVIRYDPRDTGRSVSYPHGATGYTLRDLVADAVGVLDAYERPSAHVVGFSVGGWIGQLMALDHPERVASLTLIATRPTAPGPSDVDLPEHAAEFMAYITSVAEPDWSDRAAVVDYLVGHERALAGSRPFDEAAARVRAGRILDRTTDVATSLTSLAYVDSGDRWRERLPQLRATTLVVHGTEDPFFPYGNGLALAREIPGATLLTLERAGHELARTDWDAVAPAILRHTQP